jgi:hypothetical protein
MKSVDVYPVGWLRAIQQFWSAFRAGGERPLSPLRQEARYTMCQIRKRNLRAVKNTFNGYLAEPVVMPINLHRIGAGWTKRRALRSLRREIDRLMPSSTELDQAVED